MWNKITALVVEKVLSFVVKEIMNFFERMQRNREIEDKVDEAFKGDDISDLENIINK